jgi:isopenicillin N synthase-like dioxygenase
LEASPLIIFFSEVADHTDFGCVSILLQEAGTDGLEVFYPPTGTWVPVPVIPEGFVINMGDMMQKYTGGYYRSARHRVLTNREKHRHSIAFFLNGNLKLKARSLDGSGIETVVGDHIRQRLIETMGETGNLLKRKVAPVGN